MDTRERELFEELKVYIVNPGRIGLLVKLPDPRERFIFHFNELGRDFGLQAKIPIPSTEQLS